MLEEYATRKSKDSRGTLSQYLLQMSAEANPGISHSPIIAYLIRSLNFCSLADAIIFSRFRSSINLRHLSPDVFRAVFIYLRNLWAPHVNLIVGVASVGGPELNTASFNANAVSYANFRRGKQLYGSANAHHGRSAQYAYVNGRIPVKIEYILGVKQTFNDITFTASFSVVRCFQRGDDMPDFPWAMRSVRFFSITLNGLRFCKVRLILVLTAGMLMHSANWMLLHLTSSPVISS